MVNGLWDMQKVQPLPHAACLPVFGQPLGVLPVRLGPRRVVALAPAHVQPDAACREGRRCRLPQREVAASLDSGAVEMAEAQLQIEHYWAGALRRAVIDGDVEHGSLMAGQSVGMVTKEEPIADIIAALMAEAAAALEARAA